MDDVNRQKCEDGGVVRREITNLTIDPEDLCFHLLPMTQMTTQKSSMKFLKKTGGIFAPIVVLVCLNVIFNSMNGPKN